MKASAGRVVISSRTAFQQILRAQRSVHAAERGPQVTSSRCRRLARPPARPSTGPTFSPQADCLLEAPSGLVTASSDCRQAADRRQQHRACYFTSACLGISSYIAVGDGVDAARAQSTRHALRGRPGSSPARQEVRVRSSRSSPEAFPAQPGADTARVPTLRSSPENRERRHRDERQLSGDRDYEARRSTGADLHRPNGPDLKRELPSPTPGRKTWATIFAIWAMNLQDGLDYLLRALGHLLHDLGRTDFYCVLIGDGDSLDELGAGRRSRPPGPCLLHRIHPG